MGGNMDETPAGSELTPGTRAMIAYSNRVVTVNKDAVKACMICPLCDDLLVEATAISECLHTFCRKCIYDKLTEEELECCPICEADLGDEPLEKLRPDHTLQALRNKIFPKDGKVKEPDVITIVTSLPRRKERSFSPSIVNTPRKIEKTSESEEELLEDYQGSSISPHSSNKFSQNTGESLSSCEDSQSIHSEGTENEAEPFEPKTDLCKPLSLMLELPSKSKYFKSNVQGSDTKLESVKVSESDSQVQKAKHKENRPRGKVEDEKISTCSVSSDSAKSNKLRRNRCKKEPVSRESSISSPAVLDVTSTKILRTAPVWFSLLASEDQEGDAPLPQISASYVRIKNGSVPLSFIQKYLMQKLDLTSEDEVEITCMGQPVLPSLQLYDLVESWTASTSQRIPATIGSSAEDFVMVLNYARKVPHP